MTLRNRHRDRGPVERQARQASTTLASLEAPPPPFRPRDAARRQARCSQPRPGFWSPVKWLHLPLSLSCFITPFHGKKTGEPRTQNFWNLVLYQLPPKPSSVRRRHREPIKVIGSHLPAIFGRTISNDYLKRVSMDYVPISLSPDNNSRRVSDSSPHFHKART